MKKLEPAPIRTQLLNSGTLSSQWERWFSALKTLIDSLNSTIESLQTNTTEDLTGIKKAISDLQSNMTSVHNSILTIQNDIAGINTRVTTVENDIDSIKGDLLIIQSDIETINNGISALQVSVATINEKLDFTNFKFKEDGNDLNIQHKDGGEWQNTGSGLFA